MTCLARPSRLTRAARAVAPALCAAQWALTWPASANQDLTALSLEQLMDVRVVGAAKYEQKQTEVAAAVSVVTRDEIRAHGWRTLDQVLASLPGIHLTYDRQYMYLGTRGFGLPGDYNTRVLVTINGNRVNEPTYDSGPVGRLLPLDMDLVDRVEFIPGPGGAVYGQNAMFGVVNIVTRSGAQLDGAEASVGYASPAALREGRFTWGRRLGDGTEVLLSASGLRARGDDLFMDFGDAGVSGVARGLDGERLEQFFASASRGGWQADFAYGHRRKADPTGAYLADPLVPGQFQADRYVLGQLTVDHALSDTLALTGRLFVGQETYTSELSYGTLYAFPARSRWHGAEVRLLHTGIAGHKLMLGLEVQDNARVDQSILDLSDPSNDVRIHSPGHRVGLFVQDEWALSPSVTATLGLRVDRDDATGTEISPRAAVIWRASDATVLKGLYGRAHRAPNAYERDYDDGFAQLGNPALQGETVDTLELVADHRVDAATLLRAAAYHWTMHDLITLGLDPVSGIPQYQTGAPFRASGLELSALRSWSSGLRVRGSVSLQDVPRGPDGPLVNAPRRLARLNLSTPLAVPGLQLGYEWQFEGARRTIAGAETGAYALSHLRLSWTSPAAGLELGLTVRNLLDKRYAHPGADTNWQDAIWQDGRSVRIDAALRF